jgi:GDPmannose 4,6-dehydratase
LDVLKGDYSKAKKVLGWKHNYTFETMLDEMIKHWRKIYNG